MAVSYKKIWFLLSLIYWDFLLGMAVAMLIGFRIWDEISFDNYHQKHASLGVFLSTTTYNNETTTAAYAPAPLANELRSKYADDFKQVELISEIKDHILTMGDKNIPGAGMWVENEFAGMFTLKKLKGNLLVDFCINRCWGTGNYFINGKLSKHKSRDDEPGEEFEE